MVTFSAAAADEGSVWWLWVLGGLAVWSVVALLFAVVLGRGIRLADRRSLGTGLDDLLTTADLPASLQSDAPKGSGIDWAIVVFAAAMAAGVTILARRRAARR